MIKSIRSLQVEVEDIQEQLALASTELRTTLEEALVFAGMHEWVDVVESLEKAIAELDRVESTMVRASPRPYLVRA